MNQRTHTWIAARAIGLLEEEGTEPNLAALLRHFAREASVGAWVPDAQDAKRGGAGSKTENHVLKIAPYEGRERARSTTSKDALVAELGQHRATAQFLRADQRLRPEWWGEPYKGDVDKPGQHLPNRAMALSTTLKDLVLLGDRALISLLPFPVDFHSYMHPDCCTAEEATAMYFFMLSHFVADASMPCHCDARKLTSYSGGKIHKKWEGHWSRKVGTYFEKAKLLPWGVESIAPNAGPSSDEVIQKAQDIDGNFGIDLSSATVPDLQPGHDVWLELIHVCRASFAVASVVCPPDEYPYGDDDQGPERAHLDQCRSDPPEQHLIL